MVEQSAPVFDRSTKLALDRTRASYERTMMSWIRTATSLITFGFTIYKFFQIEAPPERQRNYLIGPRGFAVALVLHRTFLAGAGNARKPPEHPVTRVAGRW